MEDESFLKGQSEVQVELVGHPVRSNIETFHGALELSLKDFRERIMHLKTDIMLLKQISRQPKTLSYRTTKKL